MHMLVLKTSYLMISPIKNYLNFGKRGIQKFRENINKNVNINGYTDDVDIANEFAEHFKNVHYCYDCDAVNDLMHYRKECIVGSDVSNYNCLKGINVELIDRCIRNMRKGKACRPDNLCMEHLTYAHPSVVMHLKLLFQLILKHGFVPSSFGCGVSIPLIKDKTDNFNDMDNYHAKTLSPVISKLFEMVLLEICSDALSTDPLHFGFKKNIGCVDAIFSLKSTIKYFNNKGSSVYIASLDIRKAFDRVKHFRLYKSLLTAGIPAIIIC